MKKNYRILLVGLIKDKNFGDPIICESVEYLIQKNNPNIRIEYACLDEYDHRGWIWIRAISKIQRKFNIKPSRVLNFLYKRYFYRKLNNIDIAIVVGGGLLKYNNQFFNGLIGLISSAEKKGIPVAFNCIGVEGYDPNNKKCLALKHSIQNSTVKYISTRDDYETLYNYYYDGKPNTKCCKVVDPAIIISEKYNINRQISSTLIGIGICRFNIFEDYGSIYSSDYIHRLYVDVIQTLLDKGYNVELFTNGVDSDNAAAEIILNEFSNQSSNLTLNIPTTSQELVTIISRYSKVIAARMHASIIAYSLNIPVVGLVWNKKLLYWAENIDQQDMYLTGENLNKTEIINRIVSTTVSHTELQTKKETLKKILYDNITMILNIPYSNQ